MTSVDWFSHRRFHDAITDDASASWAAVLVATYTRCVRREGADVEFGMCVATKLTDVDFARRCEELGFDMLWVPDSQMIWSDCYAYMALAAERTSRIRLGTGVAVAGTRIAPVIAHSIASINTLAPGRVWLGIGSGNSAYRFMNLKPLPVKQYGEEIRVIRALLDGEEVEFTFRGVTAPIRLLMADRGYVDLEHRVPIIVSGFGPEVPGRGRPAR